jgi:hypothetical protein
MKRMAFIFVAMLGLTACKPPTPSYSVTDPKTGEKTKISIDDKKGDKTITIENKDGGGTISVAENGEAPKNLPSYIPLYPGAKYAGSFAAAASESEKGGPVAGGLVSFTTNDTTEKVLGFYKDAFTRAGMKQEASGNMGSMSMLAFSKGTNEDDGVQVMASPAETAGVIQVQVIYSGGP